MITRISFTSDAVAHAAAHEIAEQANVAAKERGVFRIALSGGSTPKAAYLLLAGEPLRSTVPWDAVQIYFGDERCVPHDHADSNFRMASEALLSRVPIRKEHIFAIDTSGTPEHNAEAYAKVLERQFPPGARREDFPVFDLILLGIGPDGHTASLFPGTPAPAERKRWVTNCDPTAANPKIKPPVPRVTITAPVIWNARAVFVLATGAEKAPVLAKIFPDAEPPDPPVSRLVREARGPVHFFIDPAAWG